MAADQGEFNQLLITLNSPDNEIRAQAEESLNNITVDNRALLLLSALASPVGEDVKQMSSILLRRLFSNEFADLQLKLSPENLEHIKTQVLMGVQAEQSESLRKRMCDIAAELARNLIDQDGNNQWPQFLQFLFQCANSPSASLKDSALRMFASVPSVFGNQESNYLDVIRQMLEQSLLPTQPYEVRFQAVRAVSAFVSYHEKEMQILKHFTQLLPAMLKVVMESIEKQDGLLLPCLIELAEITPKFLRHQLPVVMELCIKVLRTDDMMNEWRHLALEIMVTLSETAPAMMRKNAGEYLVALVHEVLKMLTQLEDDENWSMSDEIIEDDSDSPNIIAESALDRLACGLGGKTVLPVIVENIPGMLSNSDWKYRHAALMAISAIGEGCHKQMEAMLPQIMDALLNFLQDPHPRVRYAACNAVGQMSADFAPDFEKKFHDKIIPGLLHVLDDDQNPRTQAHAGAALVNFSEECPKNILIQYLNPIMLKLEAILSAKFKELVEKGTKLVLEQVVTTIASVADTVEEQFTTYYDRLMPCLKCIIQNANKDDLKLLRGKTIECVSMIGVAVGPEKFMHDASEIMDLLLKTHNEVQLPDDDPQTSYLISAWTRICKILGKFLKNNFFKGKDFQRYLPLVMEPIMRTASIKPEIALLDNEDMQDIEKNVDWQFLPLGEQKNFGIKTAGLEDKASACEMLVCYARYLGEGFADYAEEVVKLMVPLLKFYFHEGVRTAAAESLPYLLESVKAKGSAYLEGMWNYICPELLKAIDNEPESEVLTDLMHSLAKCIETLGAGCLSDESMSELMKILDKLLNEYFLRVIKRGDKRKEEDYDEITEEQLEDEDCQDVHLLSKVADVLHSLFAAYKAAFYPYFDQIVGHFVKLLAPERSWADHQWALCVLDDTIEYGGPSCVKYQAYFLPAILSYIQDQSPDVRQAAVYGCGVLGQFGGASFAGFCAEALPRLVEVINDAESRSKENINPTENAISAVTKILKHNSSSINVDEVLPHWLSWLPVWEDLDESPHVYGYLCDLIQSNHPVVLGNNNSNIPNLIAIFAEAFCRNAFTPEDEIAKRILCIVRQIQTNEELFKACLQHLNSDQQRALHMALVSSTS
ncbi:Importin beta-3, putative [Pediculus humanus corporis]|uniref:Importin beta-3, putative n=1 Tax=Pediculus humanus subsp. corporis TaxID=121224 RepID=E0VBZ8_PEDHC|nr:Importin beta-3, putative [Pediculus humanus corporis]EEB10904.1 Importin beta-3, putative [Pediculus humanus corporis]